MIQVIIFITQDLQYIPDKLKCSKPQMLTSKPGGKKNK